MVLLGERSVKASADTRAGSKTGRLRPAAGSSAAKCSAVSTAWPLRTYVSWAVQRCKLHPTATSCWLLLSSTHLCIS